MARQLDANTIKMNLKGEKRKKTQKTHECKI
jgi:hypothetical protein